MVKHFDQWLARLHTMFKPSPRWTGMGEEMCLCLLRTFYDAGLTPKEAWGLAVTLDRYHLKGVKLSLAPTLMRIAYHPSEN